MQKACEAFKDIVNAHKNKENQKKRTSTKSLRSCYSNNNACDLPIKELEKYEQRFIYLVALKTIIECSGIRKKLIGPNKLCTKEFFYWKIFAAVSLQKKKKN